MSSYNLDDEDKFITFQIFDHEYQFWFPTIAQEEEARQKKIDDLDFLKSLVKKPEGAAYEDFDKAYRKMNIKQVSRFSDMILAELHSGENPSTEAS